MIIQKGYHYSVAINGLRICAFTQKPFILLLSPTISHSHSAFLTKRCSSLLSQPLCSYKLYRLIKLTVIFTEITPIGSLMTGEFHCENPCVCVRLDESGIFHKSVSLRLQ